MTRTSKRGHSASDWARRQGGPGKGARQAKADRQKAEADGTGSGQRRARRASRRELAADPDHVMRLLGLRRHSV
eukprot:3338795-Rhodomonas_salina.1